MIDLYASTQPVRRLAGPRHLLLSWPCLRNSGCGVDDGLKSFSAILSEMGLVDPCSYLFVMVARRLKSHNWPAAILLQQLRGAMKNFGGGGGGGVWIEHAAVQELPKSLSL